MRNVLLLLAALVGIGAVVGLLASAEPAPEADPSPREAAYDPYRAGEPVPPGYRQVLGRDAIVPIYHPEFVPAQRARYDDETLVIGVALEGEAHAYPVAVLNGREIVNDRLGRTPVLVTW